MLGPVVRAREEMILRPERDRAHGEFDGVGVDVDTAIVDEADEPLPSRQGVANGDGSVDLPETVARFFSSHGFIASTIGSEERARRTLLRAPTRLAPGA